jgi:hypothetical protein
MKLRILLVSLVNKTLPLTAGWILRYLRFHGGQTHPKDLGAADVERFLSDLVSPLDQL